MDRHLRPAVLTTEPSSPDALKTWRHWKRTLDFFLQSLPTTPAPNKLATLVNFVGPSVYELIAEAPTYENAIATLETAYDKPKNEVFARHLLSSCKQEQGQSLDQFLQKLKNLAKDCNFKACTAEVHKNEAIRDAFIGGLISPQIRQRLLENSSLDLDTAFENARTLDMAEKQSLSYRSENVTAAIDQTTYAKSSDIQPEGQSPDNSAAAAAGFPSDLKCFFCGYSKHPRNKCPAKEASCKKCSKMGHFAKVCRSKEKKTVSALSCEDPHNVFAATYSSAATNNLKKALINVTINNIKLKALVDTGSTDSYIDSSIVKKHRWEIFPSSLSINMASTSLTKQTQGHSVLPLRIQDRHYSQKLSLLPDLCADIILGHDFLCKHSEVSFPFEGNEDPIKILGVAAANVEAPPLFKNLSADCKPIAVKSYRLSNLEEQFVESEIRKLLKDDIIEPSSSPWRAQVLVTNGDRHKRRLVIDYSATINRYTLLDAYPLPRLDKMAESISQYQFYSTFDLKSAYHQIPLKDSDKEYTAFEACGNLYHFKRIPFGVTNGVAVFQRTIDNIIKGEKVPASFAYLDNVTVCGNSLTELEANVKLFKEASQKYGLTFNDSKSVLGVETIDVTGFRISKGEIRPDPSRLDPLRQMEPPNSLRAQKRACGMFSYYSPWISNFSDKILILTENTTFPLPPNVLQTFLRLKNELEAAVLVTIDPNLPLIVESDASDVAISATLNQEGRPVAFFSRTLTASERHHSSVEKEAYAIVEAIRKWRHFLVNTHFRLITDQKSVAFIYDNKQKGKVKNQKIQRWKIELSAYSYDVIYRPGPENHAADALSRATCGAISHDKLKALHNALSHPGVTRMVHFVRTKNLPYSVEEVKKVTSECSVCAEIKPQFYRPNKTNLVKSTQPLEKLSIDFKGPLPSVSKNKYLLTIIDEYSRFPFAFPCADMTATSVIKCLVQVFSIFGLPQYIHSDRGPQFMSQELKAFLHDKGIATSRSTPYNPRGNGQVERLNSTIWKAITLSLKSKGLPTEQWEVALTDALHSIRSLLCTETNMTPHERMFQHPRRSTNGNSLPSWLLSPGPVYLKRHVRTSKYDPLVDEVELIEANPQYAHVRLPDGKESTVSLRHLAPVGNEGLREKDSQPEAQNSADPPLDSSQLTPPNPPEPLSEPGNSESPPNVLESTDSLSSENVLDLQFEPKTSTCRTPFIRTSSYNLRSGHK